MNEKEDVHPSQVYPEGECLMPVRQKAGKAGKDYRFCAGTNMAPVFQFSKLYCGVKRFEEKAIQIEHEYTKAKRRKVLTGCSLLPQTGAVAFEQLRSKS